ncbi:MAG: hypothetical protein FD153_1811 [Rhodospirillaceae bacterium]|nr:MAG: hypothetical protein FD153_1811 [Rhodospirillaceae bacterium]
MTTATVGHHSEGSNLKEWILATNHKRIGILYLIGSMPPLS